MGDLTRPETRSAASLGELAPAAADLDREAGPFDALPDAVMVEVYKALGLRASWPLRRVCRRWRRVLEETEWASFELRVKIDASAREDEESGAADVERAFASASALFEEGRLRLGGGARVSLRPELVSTEAEAEAEEGAQDEGHLRAAAAACGLLASIARGHASGAGAGAGAAPREVVLEILRSSAKPPPLGFELDVREHGRTEDDFVGGLLLGALRSLAPPEGAAGSGASALEGLGLALTAADSDCLWAPWPWPPPGELRAALAPFAALRSLDLHFQASTGATAETAAAIAAACPLLRSLSLQLNRRNLESCSISSCAPQDLRCLIYPPPTPPPPVLRSTPKALEALAVLSHLERLLLLVCDSLCDVTGGLGALAGGPAGASLEGLAFLHSDAAFAEGEFPRRHPHAYPARTETGEALGALAGALNALPRLERLRLHLSVLNHNAGEVAALLSGPGARRALADLRLRLGRALTGAEAEAIAALPALGRLELDALFAPVQKSVAALPALDPERPEASTLLESLESDSSLRPYEALRRLRPEVRASVRLSGADPEALEGARAAVRRALEGRLPGPSRLVIHDHESL
eukprot:tig00020553_g10739.t1